MIISKNIINYTHALKLLVGRELSGRYKGTIIGVLWLFIQPMFMVIVYSFVFSVIMKVKISGVDNAYHFALFLMSAMMPFMAFQETTIAASNTLFANRSLLHKSTLPPVLLPLVPALVSVVTEGIALVIVIIAAVVLMNQYSLYLFLLPALVVIRLFLSVAIAYIVSILSVFIQDLRQALGLLLTMLLFLTPVFYPVEMIPANYLPFNNLNPFFHLLDAYRAIIIRGELPTYEIGFVAIFACFALILGILFFQKTIERSKDFV